MPRKNILLIDNPRWFFRILSFAALTCVSATNPAWSSTDNKQTAGEAGNQSAIVAGTVLLTPPAESEQQDASPDPALVNQLPPGISKGQATFLYKHMKHTARSRKLQYYFVAQNAANCEFLYGLIVDNSLIGRASVRFAFPDGCQCHGVAQVTYIRLFGGTAGQKGYIKATCSDGRSFKGHFTTTSLTTGDGTVQDSLGDQYQFTFGHTAEQAVQEIDALREQLHCSELTATEIELKVEAQILPTGARE